MPTSAQTRAVEILRAVQRGDRQRCVQGQKFAAEQSAPATGAAPAIPELATALAKATLPKGAVLELALDASLDPDASKIGDQVKATVVRAMKDGERLMIPPGVSVTGHVVRLEKRTMPFPIHEVGLEFETIVIGDRSLPLAATMEDAGPAPGLLRQSQRLDQHSPSTAPRGLRIKWRLQGETPP